MSTPFEYFRRNQKVALAAVTGMAILSFLVQDAVSNSGEMSPMGVAVLLVGSLAIVGWVWGAKDGKSGDNALFGGLVGLVAALAFTFLGRPPAAMSAITGNLSAQDLSERQMEQNIANRMQSLVFYRSDPTRVRSEPFYQQMGRPNLMEFRYSSDPRQSAIISELLNREADELGIEVTDDVVMEELLKVAGKNDTGEDNLTQQVFRDAVQETSSAFQMRANEDEIFRALKHEIRARQAAEILFGGSRATPAEAWDLYRKINVRQMAHVAAVPVSEFVKKDSQPSDSDLQALFQKHKANFPNTSPPPNPKLEEGLPGFFLPRRMKVAFVEPNYEAVEKQVGEVTEEEILQRYEERYKKSVPTGDGLDLPVLPSLPTKPAADAKPSEDGKPADSTPATSPPAPPESVPATEKTEGEKPKDTEKPADKDAKPAEPPAPEQPAAPAEKPAEPTGEKPAEPAKPEGSSRRQPRVSELQPVALIQETKPAEAPASPEPAPPAAAADAKSEEKPAADSPAEAPAKPAETPADKPAEPVKPSDSTASDPAAPSADAKPAEPLTVPPVDAPAGDMPPSSDSDPAPPVSTVRPLEDVREDLRKDILAEKTRPILKAQAEAARDYMNDLQLRVAEYLQHERALKAGKKSVLSEVALSPEAAADALKKYAKEHDMTYRETPLMSAEELFQSEEYPISGATVRESRVIDMLNQSDANNRFSASAAERFADNRSNFAFWKIEDVEAHEPTSLDEPGVKDAVIRTWRELQARPLAEKRAQELKDLVSKSEKSMAEALADQTINGTKDGTSVYLEVKATNEFSWMRSSPFGGGPQFGQIDGIEKPGEKLMETLFNTAKPGETVVVANVDQSVFYVVKIDKRNPSTDAELETLRKNFLNSETLGLLRIVNNQSLQLQSDFRDRLFVKHGVKVASESQDDNGN